MESHPIPRQITTFEFKLIGFLTLRQFIYLAVFFPLGVFFFYLVPVPLLNIFLALVPILLGIALAFVPYNERPLDIWIKNFVKKLFSSSQYYYLKNNQPPAFLKDVFIYSSPKIIQTHLEAKQKLSSYLSKKNPPTTENIRKQQLHQLIRSDTVAPSRVEPVIASSPPKEIGFHPPSTQTTMPDTSKKPFLFGVVKNSQNIPLPNSLIYIKNQSGQNVRILKTNSHGMFASFHPLPPDNYLLEIKDLEGKFFFDTMKITVNKEGGGPFNFVSKETL